MNLNKIHSSQELVLYQQHLGRFSTSQRRSTILAPPALHGGVAAAAAILTPGIRDRSEWFSINEEVLPFSLPPYISSSIHAATHKKVHYVLDKYDKIWLSRNEVLEKHCSNHSGLGKSGDCSSAPFTAVNQESMQLVERVITALEVEAQLHPETPRGKLKVTLSKGDNEGLVREIHNYWIQKRAALGNNIPCIPALRIVIKEDNQAFLCCANVLGDCPLPFKKRDWVSGMVIRSKLCSSTKREREGGSQRGSARKFCAISLKLTMQMFVREQIKLQHTHFSLYELSYLRRLALKTATDFENGVSESDERSILTEEVLSMPCIVATDGAE